MEECKYVVKEEKMSYFFTDNIEISSDDYDRENSDEENYNEDNLFSRKYKEFLFIRLCKLLPDI